MSSLDLFVEIDDVLLGLEEARRARAKDLHAFSHAVQNALFVMTTNASVLEKRDDAALHDLHKAAREIERLVAELKSATDADPALVRVPPRTLSVTAVAEAARSRGAAVSVASSAPPQIEIDPLACERIVGDFLRAAPGKLAIDGDGPSLVLSFSMENADRTILFNGQLERTLRPLASLGARVTLHQTKIEIRLPLASETHDADGDVDALIARVVTTNAAE